MDNFRVRKVREPAPAKIGTLDAAHQDFVQKLRDQSQSVQQTERELLESQIRELESATDVNQIVKRSRLEQQLREVIQKQTIKDPIQDH
jgi:hypothetical protein